MVRIHTLAFPILVLSRNASKYKKANQGIVRESTLRISLRSSTPDTSTPGLNTVSRGASFAPTSTSFWETCSLSERLSFAMVLEVFGCLV